MKTLIGTFSIVAIDKIARLMGVAVASKSIAVGSRVPWAKAGVGVVATQAYTNVMYGIKGLELLERGYSPPDALSTLTKEDESAAFRQVCILGADGNIAVHTGPECPEYAGHLVGDDYCVAGNLLTDENVLSNMAITFKETKGPFAMRLLEALRAGKSAGGDRRGHNSAAILIVKIDTFDITKPWEINLRIDYSENPIEDLINLYNIASSSIS